MSDTTEQFVPVDLPSKMAPYEEKEFFVRPLLTGEVKRLKPAILKGEAYAVLDIMKGAMRPHTPDELTDGDIWFVAAWLRLNTFPNIPLIRNWTCPKCRHENQFEVKLAELQLEELPSQYQEPVSYTLSSGRKLALRLPRAGDARKVREYLMKLKNDEPDEALMESAIVAIMIQNGESLEDRIEFVERELTAEELVDIDDFKLHFSHGLPSQVTDTCRGCGHENDRVRMSFRVYDLVPLGGSGRNIDNAIQFGTPPASADD